MKGIATITLLAVTAALVTPNTAKADDETRALIGGLIGGAIIGAALADDDFDTRVSVGYSRHGSHGYWEWVTVKTWVPGYYERVCDRYGRTRKVWVSGHFTFERQKVWREGGRYSRSHHRDHDRYDRYDRHHDRRHDRYGERGGYGSRKSHRY